MTSTVARRRELRTGLSRTLGPFSMPDRVDRSLDESVLRFGESEVTGGTTFAVSVEDIPELLDLTVRVDTASLSDALTEWGLTASDFAVIGLIEVSMLNRVETFEIPVDLSTPAGAEISVELPPWLRRVIGRARAVIWIYLVRGSKGPSDWTLNQPTAKGTTVSSWSVTLDAPQVTSFFRPRLLDDEARLRLNRLSETPIAESAVMYVQINALASATSLEDAVVVYIHPEIAGHLDRSRTSNAMRLVEANFVENVMHSILSAIRDALDRGELPSEIGESSPLWPFLHLVADEIGCTVAALLQRLGHPDDWQAIQTHLQAVSKTQRLSVATMRGERA